MARLGICDADGNVRMAGLLMLGYFPQQFFDSRLGMGAATTRLAP